MPVTAKEHREKRKALIEKAQSFVTEKEDKESGLMASEDELTYRKMMDDAASHKAAAERVERAASITDSLEEPIEGNPGIQGQDVAPPAKKKAGKIMVRMGSDNNNQPRYVEVDAGRRGSAEYQDAMKVYMKSGAAALTQDRHAALQTDDDERGGYLTVHQQFAAGLLKEVDDLLFIRQHAKVHTMMQARSLGIRKRNRRLSSFSWGTELSPPDPDKQLAYGKKVLEPHYGTGAIDISKDLMRNSVEMIEMHAREELARDAGEAQEDAYMFGDGNEKPLGIYVESKDGITSDRNVKTGDNTGFTADGLISAKYALKAQYRNGTRGMARWLFHRNAIEQIAKLKDNEGQYLFRVGAGRAQDNGPVEDMLLGFGVDESERAPNVFTPGNFGGSLQNWQYYEIADSLNMDIQILHELLARQNQIELLYRLKTDGMPTLEEAFVRLEMGA